MNQTQIRIITYLKQHPTATARELSLALSSSQANIRHHLSILQSNGMVEIYGHQSSVSRGHPIYLYRLNSQVYQNNLPGLVRASLHLLYSINNDIKQEKVLRSLANELANSLPEINGNLVQRLFQTVQGLKKLNYEPRWEARSDGPRFMFANCPYAAILGDHPELCQVDVFMLEKLLGGDISQTARIGEGTPIVRYCLFTLRVF